MNYLTVETWRPIAGCNGVEVSDLGRVFDKKADDFVKHYIHNTYSENAYHSVYLGEIGKKKPYLVHRLVAEAFLPNPNNYPIVNHKDEKKSNNTVDNLEWSTYEHNSNWGTGNKRRGKSVSTQKQRTIKILNITQSIKE